MSSQHLHLKAADPVTVSEALLHVFEKCFSNLVAQIQLVTNTGMITVTGTLSEARANTELAGYLQWARQHSYASCSKATLAAKTNKEFKLEYACENGIHGKFALQNVPAPAARNVVDALSEVVRLVPYVDLVGETASDRSEMVALQIRERSVADLNLHLEQLAKLLANITEQEAAARRRLHEELQDQFAERERKAIELHAVREKEFQERQAALLAEIEDRRRLMEEALAQKQAELDAKKAEFDLRDAKVVRRGLHEKLVKLLEEFQVWKVSEDTRRKRLPVTIVTVILASVFAAVAVSGGVGYFSTLDLHYLAPFTAGLVGLSATALYYLRWSDRWFREHAEEEFHSKRYKADMVRASWIAELTQEWTAEGKEVPKDLVDVFARNLFQDAASYGETSHPLDDVLGLLKRANKVDLSKGRIAIDAEPASKQ